MPEIKTDCFAYSKRGHCIALKELYCKHDGRCSFYKTKEEHERQLQESLKRRGEFK